MTSAAAIAGVSAYGLRWRFQIRGLQATEFGAMRGTIETPADAERLQEAWDRMVTIVRAAAERYKHGDADLYDKLVDWADENALMSVADIDIVYQGDPDAWMDSRFEDLEALYDIFDYHRVVVQS